MARNNDGGNRQALVDDELQFHRQLLGSWTVRRGSGLLGQKRLQRGESLQQWLTDPHPDAEAVSGLGVADDLVGLEVAVELGKLAQRIRTLGEIGLDRAHEDDRFVG